MKIGIHAKAAFKYERTGIEEYVYQVIKHLAMLDESKQHSFALYTSYFSKNSFFLPGHFKVEKLYAPFLGMETRLSLKMFFSPPDVLFMPANFLPAIYPRNNVVTIHGLEFEYYPEAYASDHLRYLKTHTARAVAKAKTIIATSASTKKDLIKFYNADPQKIRIIHHGVNSQIAYHHKYPPIDEKYILFIGRLEKKKNVANIVRSFGVLKEKYKIPHKLVLVGRPGFGFDEIGRAIDESRYKQDIVQTGYISHEEKESFFKHADVFVFPSFYQGFGMPILESQLRQVPLVTSNISSMAEVAGDGALHVDPHSIEEITEATYRIISDKNLRKQLVEKGLENVRQYSWFRCAKETLDVLTSQ
ncbi:hypothetical protein A3C91_05035 [Candidatus Azambacteria bacterium RIFCSPHIGHO2_02_FULL_52_12]|uniref:Glycosyl transferase family 1 domain-containing protein n=1 Tax=Candidatus Azambacteria bacterium RIFCSPLOWO2_01_FULL_46_25 TaxID=1797298 RepID=A0A1F5BVW4_9BACT|nr:MAG: hypothetical protein A3C91_05035 [Candidatus Azambacteria bacterium RIFCSPHIGHO2_02_FULL_52_12]OGD34753.1 MAG: hypothetical protein A2988_04645 [Candidatus Azambacteria bacterium RIFCSPLOWO2_01_FULL_46_25]